MKIIFLDVDGVLNSTKWLIEQYELQKGTAQTFMYRSEKEFDPIAVKLMSNFVEDIGADVVISSSWRILHSLEEINAYLTQNGWTAKLPFDVTPRTSKGFRGDEINVWLLEHFDNITSYVIFDDDGDFHPAQNLVRTNVEYGLQPEDIEKAKKYLMEM